MKYVHGPLTGHCCPHAFDRLAFLPFLILEGYMQKTLHQKEKERVWQHFRSRQQKGSSFAPSGSVSGLCSGTVLSQICPPLHGTMYTYLRIMILAIYYDTVLGSGVTQHYFQRTKFDHIVASLNPEFAMEVRDLILHPPADSPYNLLKQQLIKRTSSVSCYNSSILRTWGTVSPHSSSVGYNNSLGDQSTTFDTALFRGRMWE